MLLCYVCFSATWKEFDEELQIFRLRHAMEFTAEWPLMSSKDFLLRMTRRLKIPERQPESCPLGKANLPLYGLLATLQSMSCEKEPR
jgi:hypothetical protein